jgi:hypothetical protein
MRITRDVDLADSRRGVHEVVDKDGGRADGAARRVTTGISTPWKSAGVLIPMVTRRASLATPGCRRS